MGKTKPVFLVHSWVVQLFFKSKETISIFFFCKVVLLLWREKRLVYVEVLLRWLEKLFASLPTMLSQLLSSACYSSREIHPDHLI